MEVAYRLHLQAATVTAQEEAIEDAARYGAYIFLGDPYYEDILQEARIACWQAVPAWSPSGGAKLSTFLRTAAHYQAIHCFKCRCREGSRRHDVPVSLELLREQPAPRHWGEPNLTAIAIRIAFDALPDSSQAVIRSCVVEGYSQDTHANRQGISQMQVSRQLAKAKIKFAHELIAQGVYP